MGVIQALDQVGIARSTTAGAHCQAVGDLGFGGRGECPRFLVADIDPFDSSGRPHRVHDRVETISDDAVDALYAGLAEYLYELLGDGRHSSTVPRRSTVRAPGSASSAEVA